MNPRKHLSALAAALLLTAHASAAQEAASPVPVRAALGPIINAAGEIRYTVMLDFDYVNSLAEAARAAGYVHAGATTVDNPALRFAADRLAARIGKKPESVQTQAMMLFDVFASPQEILQLTSAEGVTGIAQREGRYDLLPPPPAQCMQISPAAERIVNDNGEVKYAVSLNPFYTNTLADAAREAGYVRKDPEVAVWDSPEIQAPHVRFAADQIAALIGKKPEKIYSAGEMFQIHATPEEIQRLVIADGVTGIREEEGAILVVLPVMPYMPGVISGHDEIRVDKPAPLFRRPIAAAHSPQTNEDIGNLFNRNHADMWNARGNYGSVVIDLGQAVDVDMIRVTPRSSVNAAENHPIEFAVAAAQDMAGNPAGAWQHRNFARHADMRPLTIPVERIHTRHMVLNAHNTGSWLAYAEIEVCGR